MRPALLPLLRIVFVSALTMFLEMMLVRWVGTELRVFAYLQNGVLIAAFLGLGLGSRNSRQPVYLLPSLLALCAVAFVTRDPWGWDLGEAVTQGLTAFQDSVIWYRLGPTPQFMRTALVAFSSMLSIALLAAIAFTFRPLGQWVGAWLDAHPRPIEAYTANILGSLLGIALFVASTAAGLGPRTWLFAAGLALAACALWSQDGRPARATAIGLALALPLFAWTSQGIWSPYQKLTMQPLFHVSPDGTARYQCGEVITVNSTTYQSMISLDPGRMAAHPEFVPPGEIATSHYVLPYELVGARARVLVVGAGSGNDVAAALRAGARQVTAVEIDPTIVQIGRARHPDQPYSSDRVRVVVDDARAFFRNSKGSYDLVWFGLLDSHTTASGYSNVRLDHFVYTEESLADMKRLLRPSGVVVLLFSPETRWITDRLIMLLTKTFGERPLSLVVGSSSPCLGFGGMLLVAGAPDALASVRRQAESDPRVRAMIVNPPARAGLRTTTDDWPYLYLERPGIPRYHQLVGALCLLIGLLLRRTLFRSGEPMNAAMLLLGMGFMLLEVVGVSRAALLFGSTWTVNAYIVGAIFAMILVANSVAARTRLHVTGWPGVGVLVSLVVVAFMPVTGIAALPLAARVVVGGLFLVLPVFFSGLVFVSAWAATERKDLALGSNLLGSLLGGVASMLSMAVGFRALILFTLAVYLAALLLLHRESALKVAKA